MKIHAAVTLIRKENADDVLAFLRHRFPGPTFYTSHASIAEAYCIMTDCPDDSKVEQIGNAADDYIELNRLNHKRPT